MFRPITPFVAAAGLLLVTYGPGLVGASEGPYVLHHGQRYPQNAAGTFYSCHELAYPQIRCFDTTEAMKGDITANFPGKRGAAEELMPGITPSFEAP